MKEAMDLTIFPKIGLVIFVSFFVLALVWVFRRHSRKIYEAESMIPFDEAPEAKHRVERPAEAKPTSDKAPTDER